MHPENGSSLPMVCSKVLESSNIHEIKIKSLFTCDTSILNIYDMSDMAVCVYVLFYYH